MTASTVNWINSGFKGNPSFLTNPEGFFTNVADQATGAFIKKTGILSQLCSPFNIDVRLALALNQAGYNDNQPYRCTLSSIINNVQNTSVNGRSIDSFMNGDFSQGGWKGFVAVGNPQNNVGRVYLQAQSDLLQKINSQQGQYQQQLVQGHGFLSWQDCKNVTPAQIQDTVSAVKDVQNISLTNSNPNDLSGLGFLGTSDMGKTAPTLKQNITAYQNSGAGSISESASGGYQSCETKTPGSVIAASLNKELGTGSDSLVTADEIDEIVGALFSQLINTVLTGGLSSASQPRSGEAQSFIDQLATDQSGSSAFSKIAQTVLGTISQYIDNSTQYKLIYDKAVVDINQLLAEYNSILQACTTTGKTGFSLQAQSVIDTQITPLLNTYRTKDDSASSTLNNLINLQNSINAATSSESLSSLSQQFNTLLNTNSVVTLVTVNDAKTDTADLAKTISGLRDQEVQYHNTSNGCYGN